MAQPVAMQDIRAAQERAIQDRLRLQAPKVALVRAMVTTIREIPRPPTARAATTAMIPPETRAIPTLPTSMSLDETATLAKPWATINMSPFATSAKNMAVTLPETSMTMCGRFADMTATDAISPSGTTSVRRSQVRNQRVPEAAGSSATGLAGVHGAPLHQSRWTVSTFNAPTSSADGVTPMRIGRTTTTASLTTDTCLLFTIVRCSTGGPITRGQAPVYSIGAGTAIPGIRVWILLQPVSRLSQRLTLVDRLPAGREPARSV